MDASGFGQIGRYGTISLMKYQETDAVVTAFGIDSEELTFGRDPGCSVRLYYPDIDLVHCKITFEDRKAFLVVLGNTGLLVDGCRVYPNATPGGPAATIPLSNGSEIEIHGKRFRFSYPPKEMRAALLATPARGNRRLRLSMIQSAQVFTPRPSKDPRENLRILKSPVKNVFRSPAKPSTLSRSPITSALHDENEEEEEEENEIVLVDGDHPRVVEEDKDLVILEDIEAPVPQPVTQARPPKTPQRRRSQSLHRAVLIRSAQRRVLEHERQRRQEEEEREEEMEVLDTIASDNISSEEGIYIDQHDYDGQEDYPPSDEETDSDEDEAKQEDDQGQRMSLWRKSLEKLWPFRNSNPTDAEAAAKDGVAEHEGLEKSSEEEEEKAMDEAQDQPEALPSLPQATPIRRPLGLFMTPQAGQKAVPFDRGQSFEPRGRLGGGPPVRYSMGGEAKRVPLESAWRVKDLVVPLKHEAQLLVIEPTGVAGAPRRSQASGQAQASPVRTRSEVSAEERKAIQERRRSALREVDSHTYFVGGIPGMSPSKASTSPAKSGFNDTNNPFRPVSPTKMASASPIKDIDRRLSTDGEDEKLDTRSLLERMKETVEGMKRRRSTVDLPISGPPELSLGTNLFDNNTQLEPTDDADKENNETAMDVDVDHEPLTLLRSHQNPRVQVVEEEPRGPTLADPPIILTVMGETTAGPQPRQQEDESVQSITQASQLKIPDRCSSTRSRSPQPTSEPTPPVMPRRTRRAAVELDQAPEAPNNNPPKRDTHKPAQATDQEENLAHATTTQTRTTRKPTIESEEPQPKRRGRKTPTVEEESVPAPKRNLRKVAVKEEKDDGVTNQTLVGRRGRVLKAAATRGVEKETSRSTTTRTRGTRAASTQPDNADADDPLDAFNETEQTPEDEAPPPPKTTARARKPRTTVKQEESTTEVLRASAKSRTSTTTATKTPATTRSRARKTPATAPAAMQVEVDKENTPGDRAPVGSAGDADEGVVVKVRTTRKTKMMPVKQEVQEATTATQPKARATRTTRSRTKTT